jgi:hypothetical protein
MGAEAPTYQLAVYAYPFALRRLVPAKRKVAVAKSSNDGITWHIDKKDVIVLANLSDRNYILELPTGQYRLDVGRKMRTLRSILNIGKIRELVSDGHLAIEE